MELIRRRGRNEHLTLIRKFLDHSKDPLRRLKALKSALGMCGPKYGVCLCVHVCLYACAWNNIDKSLLS